MTPMELGQTFRLNISLWDPLHCAVGTELAWYTVKSTNTWNCNKIECDPQVYVSKGEKNFLFVAFCALHEVPLNSVRFKNSANILTFHALNRNYYMDLNSLPFYQLYFLLRKCVYLFVHSKFWDALLINKSDAESCPWS